ncbi:MAG: hypothetical protein JST84_16865 [Acidobacteria bacterium]|nr:hypothetical protein [Acidobacteriota bacterium]
MFRKSVYITFVALCLHLAAGFVLAQDFEKSARLAASSRVSIKNVAGDVLVQGYDGDTILVRAYKEGRDRDRLTIEDFSTDSALDIRVKYPQDCNCEATIRFEVNVPRATSYEYDAFSTVAGNIKIDGAMGTLHADNVSGLILMRNIAGVMYASSFSGDVTIEQASETQTRSNGRWRRGWRRYLPYDQPVGSVLAKSISGNVKVSLNQLDRTNLNRMEFSSTSGNVEVKMPDTLGAMVDMSTTIGKLETDFPLTVVKSEFGLGGTARGRVGDGSRELKITSVAGNVALRKN